MNLKKNINVICSLLIFFIGCADEPTHSNIFDPETTNDPPSAVELRPDLINHISNTTIDISWTESGDDDFYQYKVYRSEQPGTNTNSMLVGEYAYSFWTTNSDKDLQPNTPYYYCVYTEDKGGQITASNEFNISTAPELYFRQQFADDGQTGSRTYFSQMDVISSADSNFVYVAGVSREYELILDIFGCDKYESYRRGNRKQVVLLTGDTDGDGEPDLYEIYANSDPYDSGSIPHISSKGAQPFSPIKVLVMEKDPLLTSDLFVIFNRYIAGDLSKVLKFVRNSVSEEYTLDTDWHENGIQRIKWVFGMDKLSSSQLLVNNSYDIIYYDLAGNEQSRFTCNYQRFPALISIGQDDNTGPQYIYTTDWTGIICKYDINGNFLDEWQGISAGVVYVSSIGLYADNKGNVFISENALGTINRFDSIGNLISRWYGINQEVGEFPFKFDEQLGRFGEASIGGDGESNIFILDQTPVLSSAQLY